MQSLATGLSALVADLGPEAAAALRRSRNKERYRAAVERTWRARPEVGRFVLAHTNGIYIASDERPRKGPDKHRERWVFGIYLDEPAARTEVDAWQAVLLQALQAEGLTLDELRFLQAKWEMRKRKLFPELTEGGAAGGGGYGGFGGGGFSMEDIFSQFGDIFWGAFGNMGGFESAGGRTRRRQRRGTDLRIKIKITLAEIATGVTKTLKIPTLVPDPNCHGTGAKDGTAFHTCPTCNGSGTVIRQQQTMFGISQSAVECPQCHGEGKIITEKCTHCHGEGVVRKEETVSFSIPAGVQDGMTLTVKGKGNAPRRGGINGDLLVVIEEIKHPELIRDGNDVIYNLMLDVPTAALGGSVEVPTITGRARLNIPAGTQPGKVLRLRGKGLPSPQGYGGTGDELVNVMVYIPENLTDKEREAFESLREQPNVKPSESTVNRLFSKLKHIFSND